MHNAKPLLVAMLISAAMPLQAQSLPAPLFATPGTADASSRAATTAWVRGQSYLSSVTSGQVAAALGFVPQRASVFNVLDYGAVADGVTDIGPALRTIAAKLNASTANVVLIPAGSYALNSAVVFTNGAPIIEGQGYNEGANPTTGTGTWLTINTAGFVPITFSGAFARGAVVRNIAITQFHPSQVTGWAPTNYDYVFKVLNTLGEVTFDNVLFAGVNRGIYADNSGRLLVRKVTGQFFTAGIEIDDCYDIPRIDYLHAWTYATTSPYVLAWQEAHLDTVILRRVDGIFIGDLFTLGARTALYLTTGANGVTTKLYANSVYADFSKYAVLADGNGISGQFGKVTTQHQDFAAGGGAVIAASRGMLVTGNTDQFQVDQWRSNSVGGPAIDVEGYNNRITVSDLWANTFFATSAGDGTPAVFVADSGVNPANFAQVQGTPFLQGTAPLYLYNAGVNAGRLRMPSMNAVGNDANEPRLFSNSAGNPVSVAAIGGDASVDLQLQAKSVTGSVKLQANGQTVVRVDDANSGTDDVLFRSGAGTMNLIAEGGDTNIDYFMTPKGASGGIRLQANGLTTLRTDNPNSGNTDLLVRPGTGTINLLAEGGTSGIADMTLAGLGATGGIRLLANGNTIFRVDNPNAVADDLLVRSGASTMALTAEGSDTNISLVLNPKGLGTVALGTSPNLADNSPNLVTSAWVKGQGYSTGSSAVSSVAGRIGIVALTHSDLTDWATATGTFLTSITSSQITTALGYAPTSGGITALTGDVSASGGGATTLATVNSNTGTCGDATHVGQHTLNAKGLTTACTSIAIPTASSSTAGLITTAGAAAAAPVQSYNGRAGAVVPIAGDVTAALGFTPYNAANPGSYISALGAPVQSVAARTGAIILTHSDLIDWTTATGTFLTGITSSQVTTALGYTPTSAGITALTGDGTAAGGGSDTLTLATVNGNVGAFGSSTSVPTVTINAKGLVTAASSAAIPIAGTSIAGLITTTAAGAAAPVQSVNGGTGAVTGLLATASAAAIYAPLASPTHTGTLTVAGSANNATITGAAAGNAATIAATGTDASVDLWEVAQGSAGGIRFRANGVLTMRTDSPSAGTSDLLVRSGAGAVALTIEGATNGNLVLNPAGTGTVVIPTVTTTDNSTNAASTAFVKAQGFLTSGVLQVDTFTASGTWTLNPAAKYIKAILVGCGSSGAGGIAATSGTAYSGGAGGSAAEAMVIDGPAASFTSGSVTLCTTAPGGAAGAAGTAGGTAVWNGHTAFGGGAPAPGAAGISAASGGSAGYRGGGGNASGATTGTAGAGSGSAGSVGSGIGTTVAYMGGSGAGDTIASTNTGGNAVQGPAGGGGGGYMAATQALVAGGAGGVTFDSITPAGGATAGAAGTAGGNLVMGYGAGGGGGANNTAGPGGAGGAGGTGAGGGGGGDGSTAGGPGGAGGSPLLRVVQW